MDCHFLLQGIFLTQGSNPGLLCLLHWQTGSLHLTHLGSPLKANTANSKFKVKSESVSCSAVFRSLWSMDYSLAGSSINVILQAKILEWVAIPFFRGSSWARVQTWVSCIAGRFFIAEPPGKPHIHIHEESERKKVKSLSRVLLFATPWTVAYQASPLMGFSRQEYWSGLPFPSPGDLPDPGIEPGSPALQTDALPSEPPGKAILRECEG